MRSVTVFRNYLDRPRVLTAIAALVLAIMFVGYFYDQNRLLMQNIAINESRIVKASQQISANFLGYSAAEIRYLDELISSHLQHARAGSPAGKLEPYMRRIFMKHGNLFQLRLIDTNGNELIKLVRNRNSGKISLARKRGNVANRYYFKNIMANPGKVYISNLDLNIEYGVIEQPLRPTLRVGKKVRNQPYLVVTNIDAQPIIDQLKRSAQSEGADFYLFNRTGNLLASPNPVQDWNFSTNTFKDLFPNAWRIAGKKQAGQLIERNNVITFVSFGTDSEDYVPAADSPWIFVSSVKSSLSASFFVEAIVKAMPIYLFLAAFFGFLIFRLKGEQQRVRSELGRKTEIVDALAEIQANYLADVDPGELYTEALKRILLITGATRGVFIELRSANDGRVVIDDDSVIRVVRDQSSGRFEVPDHAERAGLDSLQNITDEILENGLVVKHTVSSAYAAAAETVEIPGLADDGQLLQNFIGMPVYYASAAAAILAIANSESDFDSTLADSLKPVLDELGNIIKGFHLERERARAMMSLAASEEKVWSLLKAAPDAILVVNPDGIITTANPTAETLFGYPVTELEGMSVDRLLPGNLRRLHQEHRKSYLRNPSNRSMGRNSNLMALRADGSEIKVDISLGHGEANGEQYVVTMIRDITEKHLIDEQLRQSQKMEVVGQLTGGVAHDFNNLLGVIMGNLELCLEVENLDQQTRAFVERGMAAATRGADLTRHLLAFSRKQRLDPDYININEVLEGVDDMLQRTLGKDISIDYTFADNPGLIHVDRGLLENCILNLAINARDAMPRGGKLLIETENTAYSRIGEDPDAAADDGRYLLLSISDNGTGMSREVQQRIFDPFFTTKEFGKGSGLGMSMVFGFIKQSNGLIKVYSEEGVGTTVKILLPLYYSNVAEQEGVQEWDPERAGQFTGRILLVDDESELLLLAENMVKSIGLEVVTASSGEEAIRILKNDHNFDYLFTDVVMPGNINGIDVADFARETIPRIGIIVTSGFSREILDMKGDIDRQYVQLPKPFTKTQVMESIYYCDGGLK